MLRLTAIGFFARVALAASQSRNSVTFNQAVLPILQKTRQGGHRPGEVAPAKNEVKACSRKPAASASVVYDMPPLFVTNQPPIIRLNAASPVKIAAPEQMTV